MRSLLPVGDGSPEKRVSRLNFRSAIWTGPLVVLVAIWLWLAFSSGGYLPRQWLPASLVLGLFGLTVSLLGAYPRRPRQLSLVVLALFAAYAVWVAFSALWADSTSRVWFEAARTFGFLLILALATVFFTDKTARRMFRYLLMAATLGLLLVCTWRLWVARDILSLFMENRWYYPVSYPNNAAALYLTGFWPLMWLASGPEERAPARGLALGVATGLLGLTIMTQSRGAIWSLALSAVIMFIISPARIRLLLYLIVPALLMVYEFPNLNRYWLDGPGVLGGGLAGRTILIASVVAAFVGMILALLERWVRVSRRMKVIFGTVILLAVVGGAVYGANVFTGDSGGPWAWASKAWDQFTGQTKPESESESKSRLVVVSSSGRVAIWKVGWQEFKETPILGVGADNFIFEYDRLRTTETFKPQQAHSLELQVLAETGVVGGVFAFGGMLLALGGVLWPRCVSGWRGARRSWLRPHGGDRHAETASHFSTPRWGDRSIEYGWEMALLAGVTYWLIHASVDWLWQMAGVAIPMLLLLAAALAQVDARAGVLWPRWHRWLRTKTSYATVDNSTHALATVEAAQHEANTETKQWTGENVGDEETARSLFLATRRTDRHLAKHQRQLKRDLRRSRSLASLQPPGLLSHAFRALLVTLSVVVILGVGLPYLSIQYQKSALALARTDGAKAAQRAEAAHWFQLADPGPYVTQAMIYTNAATSAALSDSADRSGAALDNLALSVASFQKAIATEPADWSLRYRAGVAALNLLVALESSGDQGFNLDYRDMFSSIPELRDWSSLKGADEPAPDAGQASGSLAVGPKVAEAQHLRSYSPMQLVDLSQTYLNEAKARNPLAPEVGEAIGLLKEIRVLLSPSH